MTTTKPQIRTQEEIQDLKRQWRNGPIWDIYETEGFEAHREELEIYQTSVEKEWEEARKKRFDEYAESMGLQDNHKLARYIKRLENDVSHLEKRLEKLEL